MSYMIGLTMSRIQTLYKKFLCLSYISYLYIIYIKYLNSMSEEILNSFHLSLKFHQMFLRIRNRPKIENLKRLALERNIRISCPKLFILKMRNTRTKEIDLYPR